jgi:hypothetical protein
VNDCEPLSQIAADDGGSFICCGFNDESTRKHASDRYRHCWVNSEVDEMSDWDDRDIADTISVLSGALSVAANRDLNKLGDELSGEG